LLRKKGFFIERVGLGFVGLSIGWIGGLARFGGSFVGRWMLGAWCVGRFFARIGGPFFVLLP
jgi:hypothetical protein